MGEYEPLRKKIFFISRSTERLQHALRLSIVRGDEAWWHFMRREAWLHLKRSLELLIMVLRKRRWPSLQHEAWVHLKCSVELLYMVLRKRNGERR